VLHGVIVWAPGRIGCLCNGLYAVLSSGIVFRASFSKNSMNYTSTPIVMPLQAYYQYCIDDDTTDIQSVSTMP